MATGFTFQFLRFFPKRFHPGFREHLIRSDSGPLDKLYGQGPFDIPFKAVFVASKLWTVHIFRPNFFGDPVEISLFYFSIVMHTRIGTGYYGWLMGKGAREVSILRDGTTVVQPIQVSVW